MKEDVRGTTTLEEGRRRYECNACVDAIEALILAHACAGVDIDTLPYKDGVSATFEQIANRLG